MGEFENDDIINIDVNLTCGGGLSVQGDRQNAGTAVRMNIEVGSKPISDCDEPSEPCMVSSLWFPLTAAEARALADALLAAAAHSEAADTKKGS